MFGFSYHFGKWGKKQMKSGIMSKKPFGKTGNNMTESTRSSSVHIKWTFLYRLHVWWVFFLLSHPLFLTLCSHNSDNQPGLHLEWAQIWDVENTQQQVVTVGSHIWFKMFALKTTSIFFNPAKAGSIQLEGLNINTTSTIASWQKSASDAFVIPEFALVLQHWTNQFIFLSSVSSVQAVFGHHRRKWG